MTARDIDVFFERGQLGTSSPESILNSMWFMVNLYFGPKGVREHANMVRMCACVCARFLVRQEVDSPHKHYNVWPIKSYAQLLLSLITQDSKTTPFVVVVKRESFTQGNMGSSRKSVLFW